MKMKKLSALLLAAVMAFTMTACGSAGDDSSAGGNAGDTKTEDTSGDDASTGGDEADTSGDDASADASAGEDSGEADSGEVLELNVAYMPNYASLWSVLTGMDQGYFEEEGLSIKLWEFADGPSEIAAMEGGSIDLAYIGHGAHRLCINGQASIFAPSSVHSTDKIIVLTSHGLESVNDLKGKKIAYSAGSSSETALNGALAVAGLTMDDIEAYEMDATNMVAAMNSGSVDACTAWNPYSNQILENNEDAVELEFATDSVNLSSWICMPDYAKENRDVLVRFSRALYKAMAYASQEDNWDYAVGLYAKQCAKDKEACQVETGDATWFSSDDVKNGIADNTMQDYYTKEQDMFLDSVDVECEVPLEDYILFDVMEEALGS